METGKASKTDETRFPGISEELTCALQGCRVILFVDEFDNKIFNTLALGDIKQYGGYSRYTDQQDQQVILKENERQKALAEQREELNREMFGKGGVHDFIRDHRLTQLQHGERDIKRLLGIKGQANWETRKPLVNEFGKEFK
jgi:hypothetical protein